MNYTILAGWCAALLVAVCASGLSQASSDVAQAKIAQTPTRMDELRQRLLTSKADDVMVIAHRACWREAPENSVPAIEACDRIGVDMVEIDVHVSSDGHLVIMHDETLDRTTNGTGLVSSMTLAELKSLYLREGQGGKNAALTAYKIPTLEEALRAARGRVLVNLDAKGDTLFRSLAAVRKLGVADGILFKGADILPKDLVLFEGAYFMPVVRDKSGDVGTLMSDYKAHPPVAFELVYEDPDYLLKNSKDIVTGGYRLWVNTMWEGLAAQQTDAAAKQDPDATWGYLVSKGVNMIQTDDPRGLLEYLRAKKLRKY